METIDYTDPHGGEPQVVDYTDPNQGNKTGRVVIVNPPTAEAANEEPRVITN